MPGTFYPFFLPFAEQGRIVPSMEQAGRIIDEARKHLDAGAVGFAITYSANYSQAQEIKKTYSESGWLTGISGANQAGVMRCMELLLETEFPQYRDGIRIAPVTTMTYSDFGGRHHLDVVKQDLEDIRMLLESGWVVAGWVNQSSQPDFAIGGGIAQLPADVSLFIQQKLHRFCIDYPLER